MKITDFATLWWGDLGEIGSEAYLGPLKSHYISFLCSETIRRLLLELPTRHHPASLCTVWAVQYHVGSPAEGPGCLPMKIVLKQTLQTSDLKDIALGSEAGLQISRAG